MMKNFNGIAKLLAANPVLEKQVRLLGISIDPEYDTPEVLKAYGEKRISGPNPFAHWDLATGSVEDIRQIAAWFGLTYFRESGQITHSLVTAVIDKAGRLLKVFPANSWRPQDIVDVVQQSAN